MGVNATGPGGEVKAALVAVAMRRSRLGPMQPAGAALKTLTTSFQSCVFMISDAPPYNCYFVDFLGTRNFIHKGLHSHSYFR